MVIPVQIKRLSVIYALAATVTFILLHSITIQSKHMLSHLKEFQQHNVVVRDNNNLEGKLRNLIRDGADKLQVIADFDSTLTKAVVDGKPTAHTLDIFARTETLSQAYRDGCATLAKKYELKISSPELTQAQKQQLLDQWWIDHENLTVGENVTVADIQNSTDTINTPLRDGCEEMLSLLSRYQVPVVVISAGLGEVIAHVLQHFKPKIVSNFLRFDEESRVLGFTRPTVSVYNKNKIAFPVERPRQNVILLGDSLGDCSMADNVLDTSIVLKIGFLTGGDNEELEKYQKCYDIVLVDDQTMHTVTALLKLVMDTL